jgi:hypothetical protein
MTAAQEWMLEGMEKGFIKGREEGREEGREDGREEGERAALASILTKQVRLRFRDVPPGRASSIEAASKAELERWLERILMAKTLDDVFA